MIGLQWNDTFILFVIVNLQELGVIVQVYRSQWSKKFASQGEETFRRHRKALKVAIDTRKASTTFDDSRKVLFDRLRQV